jgi:hypothetical protein
MESGSSFLYLQGELQEHLQPNPGPLGPEGAKAPSLLLPTPTTQKWQGHQADPGWGVGRQGNYCELKFLKC